MSALSINGADPAYDCEAVTPSDSTEYLYRALFVGGAGTVVVVTPNGNTVTFTGVLAGSILPVQGTKVKAASTATNIVALK